MVVVVVVAEECESASGEDDGVKEGGLQESPPGTAELACRWGRGERRFGGGGGGGGGFGGGASEMMRRGG